MVEIEIEIDWTVSHDAHVHIPNVRKISSGFEYFLLIFVIVFGLVLKVVGLDVELNSESNGDV